jgi:hypothetical protein
MAGESRAAGVYDGGARASRVDERVESRMVFERAD